MDSSLTNKAEHDTTAPVMVPDRLISRSYNWPASVHDTIERLADARHTSASKMGLELVKRGLGALEVQTLEGA